MLISNLTKLSNSTTFLKIRAKNWCLDILSLQNVKQVFDAAIKVVLQPPKAKKKKGKAQKACSILWSTTLGVMICPTLSLSRVVFRSLSPQKRRTRSALCIPSIKVLGGSEILLCALIIYPSVSSTLLSQLFLCDFFPFFFHSLYQTKVLWCQGFFYIDFLTFIYTYIYKYIYTYGCNYSLGFVTHIPFIFAYSFMQLCDMLTTQSGGAHLLLLLDLFFFWIMGFAIFSWFIYFLELLA